MMRHVMVMVMAGVAMAGSLSAEQDATQPPPVLDFRINSLSGEPVDLAKYHGKVIVMVNVASRCGMTPQYAPLQALYEEHKDGGLVILGFPANNFGSQEPGTHEEIAAFCEENYGVTFDMFEKISVRGDDIHPLYAYLTTQTGEHAREIGWNFTKFIISREGEVVARFEPRQRPDSEEFVKVIETELAKERD